MKIFNKEFYKRVRPLVGAVVFFIVTFVPGIIIGGISEYLYLKIYRTDVYPIGNYSLPIGYMIDMFLVFGWMPVGINLIKLFEKFKERKVKKCE